MTNKNFFETAMKTVVALAVSMTSFACTSCDDDDVTTNDQKDPEVPEVIVPEASKFNVKFVNAVRNNELIATSALVDSATSVISADLFAKSSEINLDTLMVGYEFVGLNPTEFTLTSDTTVYALYNPIEYTVRFYGSDLKTVIDSITGLTIGDKISSDMDEYKEHFAINTNIVKQYDEHCAVTMKGWTMNEMTITENVIKNNDFNIYPLFNESHKLTVYVLDVETGEYNVEHSFNVECGSTVKVADYLSRVSVPYGYEKPYISLEKNGEEYKNDEITFDNANNHSDKEYEVYVMYDIRYWTVNVDGVDYKVAHMGNILDENEVEVPTKAETESETYEFKGWFENGVEVDLDGMAITRDMVVVSEFKSITKTFEVKFIVDGVVVATENVKYGESATAPNADKDGYTMKWVGNYTNVTKNEVVEAVYTAIPDTEVSVKFVGYNEGTKVVKFAWNESVSDASVIAKLGNLEVEGYTWKYENGVVTYTIKTFKVTFDFGGIRENVEVEVEYGKSADAPSDVEVEGYTFDGWNGKFENITSDNVVYAKYTAWTITISDKDAEGKVTVTPNADCKYVCVTMKKTAYDKNGLDNADNLANIIKTYFNNPAYVNVKEITPYTGDITIAFFTKVEDLSTLTADKIIGGVVTKVW